MTWLRSLDELTLADLRIVGYKAYYLAMLKQQGLPVAEGWVLVADAWHQCLDQMPWAELGGDRLTDLQPSDFRRLQQTSKQWQQAMQSLSAKVSMAPDWQTAAPDFVPVAWMLRASLWVDQATPLRVWAGGSGLLSAWVEADIDALPQMLPPFWSQALTARCLLVWRPHCQRLRNLCLATLITPIYPAVLSGTLTLSNGHGTVTTVAGLGQALTQGEAIPARCQVDQGRVGEAVWQSGFQERLHQLRPAAKYRSRQTTHQTTMAATIQLVQRDRPELHAPLNNAQLARLLTLGEAAQKALTASGVRLEWLLYPGTDPTQPTLVITQADPWQPIAPDLPGPARSQPTLVPMVSTVVQGIGASAGCMQGQAVVAQRFQELPQPLAPGCVVVLPDLQPDAFLQLEMVRGLVIEQGGATCHAAILAREMGIPAVVGAPQATQLLDSGMVIWLDGSRGLVYGLSPESAAQPQVQRAIAKLQTNSAVAEPPSPEQRGHYQQLRTKVMVNLSQPRRLATLPWEAISGVGLLRSEWLLLDALEGRHPWDWVNRGQEAELQGRIVQQLEPILQALGPKPLRYRSLDLRSHEWQGLAGSPPVEPNPMLGLRGTLSYEIDSRLFDVELAALANLQRAGYTNLQLILPFVRTVEEVIACRQPIERSGLTDHSDFALWIMAEVPSVLFLLPAYAQAGVQGIAIGSNDLTQLLLAVDRDQPIIASAYDERHPVVRLAMGHLVKEAQRCGLLCSICGQAPVRHPELIADLVSWGINSISVEATALPFTLEAVWQAEMGG